MKNYLIFGLLLGFFSVLSIKGCGTAQANDLDLNVVEARFFSSENEMEIDAETTQLQDEFQIGEEVFEPDNRNLAHNVPTPKVFKDSDIKRKLKDGSTQSFDGDKYMIVRRTHKHKKPKKPVVKIVEKEVKVHDKRAVSFMLGHGPTENLDVNYNNGSASVDNSAGVIGTLQYQQTFNNEGWFWSGQLQTNKAYSLGIGKGF